MSIFISINTVIIGYKLIYIIIIIITSLFFFNTIYYNNRFNLVKFILIKLFLSVIYIKLFIELPLKKIL